MNLITGRTGTKHVFARHDALINKTFLGDGDFVLAVGDELAARRNPQQGATGVDIFDGYLMMQGRLCEIPDGTVDTIILDGGAEGLKRMDLIIAEYTINSETGIENVEIKALKGTPSTNTYLRPTVEYESGIIDNGETHQMVLYEVRIYEFSILSITKAFATLNTLPIQSALDYARSTSEYVKEILDQLTSVVSIFPFISFSFTNVQTTGGSMSLSISGYEPELLDFYDLYLNGLMVMSSDYSISVENDTMSIDLSYDNDTTYNEVYVVVWRRSTE